MPRTFAIIVIVLLAIVPGRAAGGQVRVQGLDGHTSLDPFTAPPGTKAVVFLFTSTDCPISNRYAPEVRRIAEAFGSKGVAFRLVYPNPAEQPAAIREHMSAFAYAGAIGLPGAAGAGGEIMAVRDPRQALVKFTGATVTPEAAVYAGGRVVYRGRIDDRYVDLGVDRPAPTTRDLADALTSVLAGSKIAQPVTQAVGCYIADFAR